MNLESVPAVLIDASNLHSGGGVQVAASFLDELAALAEQPDVMDRYPWLGQIHVEVSNEVRADVTLRTLSALSLRTVDRHPRHLLRRRCGGYDLSFAVFGPEYGPGRARRRVVGFADSTVIQRRPAGVPRPTMGKRLRNEVRAVVSRAFFRRAHLLVVETEATRDDLAAALGFDRESIRVVPNSVNGVFDEPGRWRPVDGLPELPRGVHLLAYVSRAHPHKNIDFLGLVGDSASQLVGIRLVFLLTLTEQEWRGLSERTRNYSHNVGVVTVDQVPSVLQAADAVIFPSLLESFSAMPLEAMAVGKAVFASDRPFVRTTCGDAPIYIDPLDPQMAAAVVTGSLMNPDLLAEHSCRGRAVVRDLPSSRDRALAYLAIIDDELTAGCER